MELEKYVLKLREEAEMLDLFEAPNFLSEEGIVVVKALVIDDSRPLYDKWGFWGEEKDVSIFRWQRGGRENSPASLKVWNIHKASRRNYEVTEGDNNEPSVEICKLLYKDLEVINDYHGTDEYSETTWK